MILDLDRFFNMRDYMTKKISRSKLNQIVLEELQKALEEDALISKAAKRKNAYRKKDNNKCSECGYTMEEKNSTCEQCGSKNEKSAKKSMINESDCGCSECEECNESAVVLYKKHGGKSHHGAYMSRSQLYKVAKYAQKLYYMIPPDHDLEDWMRTKLAQIADDIGEVYHAIDHDIYEGDV